MPAVGERESARFLSASCATAALVHEICVCEGRVRTSEMPADGRVRIIGRCPILLLLVLLLLIDIPHSSAPPTPHHPPASLAAVAFS